MRPLPIEPLGDAPPYVRGVSIIRGEPTAVLDTARLLGHDRTAHAARFVVMRAGDRRIALLFDEVIGVRTLSQHELAALPPLVRSVAPAAVAAIGAADRTIVLLLESAFAIPADLIERIDRARSPGASA